MSMRITQRAKATIAALASVGVALGLAGAAQGITVYANDFSNIAEYEQIVRSGGGKACKTRYRENQKTILTSVRKGPATCAYKAPVQGDSELPDHALGVDAKILDGTPKAIREGSFVELTLRAGGGGIGYTLRVFPQKRKYEISRGPSGGGFPVVGKSKAINRVGDRNRLSFVARGASLIAKANGKQLATVTDDDPGQVTGRKVRFAIGSAKKTQKDVVAVIKSVNVGVPRR